MSQFVEKLKNYEITNKKLYNFMVNPNYIVFYVIF